MLFSSHTRQVSSHSQRLPRPPQHLAALSETITVVLQGDLHRQQQQLHQPRSVPRGAAQLAAVGSDLQAGRMEPSDAPSRAFRAFCSDRRPHGSQAGQIHVEIRNLVFLGKHGDLSSDDVSLSSISPIRTNDVSLRHRRLSCFLWMTICQVQLGQDVQELRLPQKIPQAPHQAQALLNVAATGQRPHGGPVGDVPAATAPRG